MHPHVLELALSRALIDTLSKDGDSGQIFDELKTKLSKGQYDELLAHAHIQDQVSLFNLVTEGHISPHKLFSFSLCGPAHPNSISIKNQALEKGLLSADSGALFESSSHYQCSQCQGRYLAHGTHFPKILECSICGRPSCQITDADQVEKATPLLEAARSGLADAPVTASDENKEDGESEVPVDQEDSTKTIVSNVKNNFRASRQYSQANAEKLSAQALDSKLLVSHAKTMIDPDEQLADKALAEAIEKAEGHQATARLDLEDLSNSAWAAPSAEVAYEERHRVSGVSSAAEIQDVQTVDVNAATLINLEKHVSQPTDSDFQQAPTLRGDQELALTVVHDKPQLASSPISQSGKSAANRFSAVGHSKSDYLRRFRNSPSRSACGSDAAVTESLDDLIGREVGGWTLHELLGKGGMGAVFRGSDAGGRQAAIKVILPELKDAKKYLPRFRQEASVLKKLDHPNIVSFLDFGTEPLPYVV